MRIVYMGTPDFAVRALDELVENGYRPELVVAKADRPKDRGKKMQSCPVKLRALELGIPVETPEKVKNNEEFVQLLKDINPDLMIVAAYGKILPLEVLNIPKYGCINIHGSLLPKYRGAAPIQRAVMNCEEKTGVTLMYMAEGMDTGDMIAKVETEVGEKTADELFTELADLGAKLLLEYLPKIADGTAPREPQKEEEATYAPMIEKEIIDWTKPAKEIAGHVRGTDCRCTYKDQMMKVHYAVAVEGKGQPGEVVFVDKKNVHVACGEGCLSLKTVQLPGKKAMDISAFLLGNKIEVGTILG